MPTPRSRRMASGAPRLRFLYSGIRVRDVDRSLRFYESLGFRVRARGTMEHGGVWVQLALPRQSSRLELNYYPQGNRFYEPIRRGTEFDHFGFYVEDMAGWARSLKRLKVPIRSDFVEHGRTRLIYAADPDGNWLEFFGPVARPRRRRE